MAAYFTACSRPGWQSLGSSCCQPMAAVKGPLRPPGGLHVCMHDAIPLSQPGMQLAALLRALNAWQSAVTGTGIAGVVLCASACFRGA